VASGLTAREIERAQIPKEKTFVKLFDSFPGLYLRKTPNHSTWYVRFRPKAGDPASKKIKDTDVKLGRFAPGEPSHIDVSEARRLAGIRQGEAARQTAKPLVATFGAMLDNHIRTHRAARRPAMQVRQEWLAGLLEPWRERPVREIEAHELRDFLQSFSNDGKIETAHRLRRLMANVFEDAETLKLCADNPAAKLARFLPERNENTRKGYAFISDRIRFGELLIATDNYYSAPGPHNAVSAFVLPYIEPSAKLRARRMSAATFTVGMLLKFLPLVATRKNEAQKMRWSHVDLKNPEGPMWKVPAENEKTKKKLEVPLSRQAVAIIENMAMYRTSEDDTYVFEGRAGSSEPLSENAVGAALKVMGFGGEHTAHGYRYTFSTFCNEKGWNYDLVERALNHKGEHIRKLYDHSVQWQARRKLMQDWADYLDELKAEAAARNAPVTP